MDNKEKKEIEEVEKINNVAMPRLVMYERNKEIMANLSPSGELTAEVLSAWLDFWIDEARRSVEYFFILTFLNLSPIDVDTFYNKLEIYGHLFNIREKHKQLKTMLNENSLTNGLYGAHNATISKLHLSHNYKYRERSDSRVDHSGKLDLGRAFE